MVMSSTVLRPATLSASVDADAVQPSAPACALATIVRLVSGRKAQLGGAVVLTACDRCGALDSP
jgi:mannitol-1-phosphate/altronate dehydrogenase